MLAVCYKHDILILYFVHNEQFLTEQEISVKELGD